MYAAEDMNQRCAYVDTHILFMQWDGQKDGWIPDLSAMQQHREGNLRVYHPADAEEILVTMPGHVLWPVKFDGADIREVLEMPWVPSALQGMTEAEIDQLDAYRLSTDALSIPPILRVDVRINAPLTRVEVNIPSRFEEELAASILASLSSYRHPTPVQPVQPPPLLPVHIRSIVLGHAESVNQTCSISLEPIRSTTASVTSCGHIFQTAAIQEWLSENQTCPECRKPCSV